MISNCTVDQTYNALVTDKVRQGGFTYSLTAMISQYGKTDSKWTTSLAGFRILDI
jgi:hypothetical protein